MTLLSLASFRLGFTSLLLACSLIAGFLSSSTTNASAPPAPKKCTQADEFKDIPGQGPSCKHSNGNWKIKLKDGKIVESHGPDAAPEAYLTTAEATSALAASSHVCVSRSTYHGLMIYAYPSDKVNRYSSMVATLRSYFQGTQDMLNAEAMEFGVSASYKMACDTDGQITVLSVRLPTTTAGDSFSSILNDLQAQGYNSTLAKYWIWYDDRMVSACGQGTVESDDRATVNNLNNSGPSYAISYGYDCFMHENGHNLGAVQNSAPTTSGAYHCNDGLDVMCYADGGPYSYYNPNVCSVKHYDCNHNDYFHPNPPSNNYLYNHWNVAACYNRYIQRSGCGATPTATPIPSTEKVVNGGFESGSSPWVINAPYTIISTSSPHSGSYGVYMGGSNNTNITFYQTITVPSNGTLRYWWQHTSQNTSSGDFLRAQLYDTSGTLISTLITNTSSSPQYTWKQESISLASYAGRQVRLHFQFVTDASVLSWFYVDDISVK